MRAAPPSRRDARCRSSSAARAGRRSQRAADYGDGWYGFDLGPGEAAEKITLLRQLLVARGRGGAAFELVVAPFTRRVTPDDLAAYQALGVGEVVIVGAPPDDPAAVAPWVERLAAKWVTAGAALD